MQPCNKIYYSKIYWRLNRFRAAYRSSSGAPNCIFSLWFIYPCGDWPLFRLGGNWPEAANTVWSSWWWVVCRSKQVEPSINFGIINFITRLHLVGYFYWFNMSLFKVFLFLSKTEFQQYFWMPHVSPPITGDQGVEPHGSKIKMRIVSVRQTHCNRWQYSSIENVQF
jgi:hypothetical protein